MIKFRLTGRYVILISIVLVFMAGAGIGAMLGEGRLFPEAYVSLKSKVLRPAIRSVFRNGTEDSYSEPVNGELTRFFGQALELENKSRFTYAAPPNDDFVQGLLPTEDYFYGPSVFGAMKYFTSPDMTAKRSHSLAATSDVASTVARVLGVGVVDLGAIESVETHPVETPSDMEVLYYELTFGTGAVAQFYLATPHVATGRLMVALHGCSSSPDKVLGLSKPDYTNSFGLEAVKMGWTVVAPYILNECDYIDDFDALGMVTSGATLTGYEVQKVQAVVDYVVGDNPVEQVDIYGISFGGIIAMMLATLDPSYRDVIVSGAMVFDYSFFGTYIRDHMFPAKPGARLARYNELLRYVEADDLLLAITERGDSRLVVEIGAYDAQENEESQHPGTVVRFLDRCTRVIADCSSRVYVNFFRGYHETNPLPSLQFIRSSLDGNGQ